MIILTILILFIIPISSQALSPTYETYADDSQLLLAPTHFAPHNVTENEKIALRALMSSISGWPSDWKESSIQYACDWTGLFCNGIDGIVRLS